MRVAVLGQGSIGRRHAGSLLELGHEVVAWDPVAEIVAGAHRAQSAEEALSGAEAAIVASPSSAHAEQAGLALEHGCHVLVEKPLALTVEHAAPLVEAADRGGLVLGVAMNLRFHPGVRAVRDAVASGAVGTPLVARAWFGSWLPGWRPGVDYRASYSARRNLGGGVLLDAIHEIDYLTWVLGPVSEVSARLATVSDLEIDVEDVAQLQLAFASGAQGSVTLDYLDRSYDRGCRVVGSAGSVLWSWPERRVVLFPEDGAGEVLDIESDAAPTYAAEMAAFIEAVETGAPVSTSGEEGLHALAVVDAARRADTTGGRVSVAI